MERLVAAARDLANETGSAAFTVQQVCARAGVSLKGFYAAFPGKDELLIALLEEDSRIGAELLGSVVAAHDEPLARLRAYVDNLFALVALPGATGYARVLVREHRRLGEDHPDELAGALAPLVTILASEIERATRAGVLASADPARDAETMFAVVLGGVHDVTIGRADPADTASYLWQFCCSGLKGPR
jgi:AcrR family transcriptional regulator